MKRTYEAESMCKTKNLKKNLERFAKKFPNAAPFCEIEEGTTIESMKKYLPITDKNLADGNINNDWTYYFDVDFDQELMYIWYIERQ